MLNNPYQIATLAPGSTDALAAIANAIAHLPPSGGCVDARQLSGTLTGAATVVVNLPVTLLLGPVQIQVSANIAFQVVGTDHIPPNPISSLTVLGLDPNSTVLVATHANITLFELTGEMSWGDYTGGETLTIKRCGLCGGNPGGNGGYAGTVMVNAQGFSTTNNFEQGLLLIEDNLITNFGDTAIKIGQSVNFNRIHRNEFLCNNQAIYLDTNTDGSISENNFLQGPGATGPTITSIGPMHRIVHNYFYRNAIPDTSNQPDILLEPKAGLWAGQSGGYVWIEDNRFGSELENLDPARRRIKLAGANQTILAGGAVVRGNYFLGPVMYGTIDASGTMATMTLDASQAFVTQGLIAGTQVTITYNYAETAPGAVPDYVLFGTFPVLNKITPPQTTPPTPPTQFTYTLPVPTNASGVGATVRLAAAAAIELDNPHMAWDVHGNFFANYGVLIDDNQCPPATTQNGGAGWGESLFVDNRVFCPQGGYKVFTNEGNDFTWIRPPANSSLKAVDPWPKQNETLSLRNRLPQSERLDLWYKNDLTVSPNLTVNPLQPGEPDPFGTNRAFLLTLTGTLGNQNLQSLYIDLSGLTSTSRLVIKFWARQGTPTSTVTSPPTSPLTSLYVGVLDVSQEGLGGWFGNLFLASLGPDWKQYKFMTNQLYSLKDNFALVFYPGDLSFTAGNVFLFAPQISDDDSDYYPTGASAISDASAGSRFEKAVILTSLKTTTHTGDPSSAPSVTATGLGTGSAALQAGSTDFSGVVLLSPSASAVVGPAASGSVTLTYNVPYVGTNPPVVVASLQDVSSPGWTPGTSQVRVTSSPNSFLPPNSFVSCVLAWVNGSALSSTSTYAIAYVVIGVA